MTTGRNQTTHVSVEKERMVSSQWDDVEVKKSGKELSCPTTKIKTDKPNYTFRRDVLRPQFPPKRISDGVPKHFSR